MIELKKNRWRSLALLALRGGWFVLLWMSSLAPARAAVEVTLTALLEQMKYDLPEFSVFPGESVRLTFKNDDVMQHNVVICLPRAFITPNQPEEDNGFEVAQAAWELGEAAPRLHWVPKHPRVLAATKMIDGGTTTAIEFTVPTKPGRYPYVCTFPGHAKIMFGTMRVEPRVAGFRELHYRVFQGPFSEFPDFSSLRDRKAAEGKIPDGLIDARVGGDQSSFALEFEGVLPISETGEYHFGVAGDNGPLLIIGDKVVVDHRAGERWESSTWGKVTLGAGDHRVIFQYWHARGDRKRVPEVTLLWSSEHFKDRPLSRVDLIGRYREKVAEIDVGMPLKPEKDEPVFYRNFLSDLTPQGFGVGYEGRRIRAEYGEAAVLMPSGFGVGYPGGANITWDPVTMNVGYMWAGAFLDVKRQRSDFRGGPIKPNGFAVVRPAPGRAFAVLDHPAMAWPAAKSGGADEIEFLGYTFDDRRRPTFRHRFRNVIISDTFTAAGNAQGNNLVLSRRLALRAKGSPPRGLMFRVLHSPEVAIQQDGFVLENEMKVIAKAGEPIVRPNGEAKEVLLPMEFSGDNAVLHITYSWMGSHH